MKPGLVVSTSVVCDGLVADVSADYEVGEHGFEVEAADVLVEAGLWAEEHPAPVPADHVPGVGLVGDSSLHVGDGDVEAVCLVALAAVDCFSGFPVAA